MPIALLCVIVLAFGLGLTSVAPAMAQAKNDKLRDPGLLVLAPWSRATPGGSKIGVAFLDIKAAAKGGDKLVTARSPIAVNVELHTHSHDGGVMRMRRVDNIVVEAGGTVSLKPGGYHIMLLGLKQPLKQGQQFPLTLVFEKAGEVAINVPVLKIGAPGLPGKSKGAHHHGDPGSAYPTRSKP